MGMRGIAKRALSRYAPGWAERVQAWWLLREASALRRRCLWTRGVDGLVDLFLKNRAFRVNQKRAEILALLRLLQQEPPRSVCEIGADRGGTLGLFAAVAAADARLLSLDLRYPTARRRALPYLARGGQHITCLAADSHHPQTLNAVRRWLGGRALDFLFIDGDHSLPGVASDFAMYAPLVRPGGWIALHDIVADHRGRFGTATAADAGGVPIFWRELTTRGDFATQELIDDREQDGYGLGVLRWQSARAA